MTITLSMLIQLYVLLCLFNTLVIFAKTYKYQIFKAILTTESSEVKMFSYLLTSLFMGFIPIYGTYLTIEFLNWSDKKMIQLVFVEAETKREKEDK